VPKATFVIFLHAGGISTSYLPLISKMKTVFPDYDFKIISLPGRLDVDKTRPFQDWSEVTRFVVTELKCIRSPIIFVGISFGGSVSYEVSKLAHVEKFDLIGLVVINSPSPDVNISHRLEAVLGSKELLSEFMFENSNSVDKRDFFEHVFPHISDAMIADLNLRRKWSYMEHKAINYPILALLSKNDSRVRREDMEGWRSYSQEGFSLGEIPGGHLPKEKEFLSAIDLTIKWVG